MLDGFARSITYLRISITDRCNYRCRYCMPDEWRGKARARRTSVRSEELRDMAAAGGQARRQKDYRVTGGEPLVRRGAVDFCRDARQAFQALKSSASRRTAACSESLPSRCATRGVTHLNISLDTLNEERFRTITRLGTLQDVIDGIDAAERAGFAKIKLNCVLLGGVNDDEIADFVALTREHAVAGALHRAHADGLRQGLSGPISPRRRSWTAVRSWSPFRMTAWPRATVCRMQRGPSASSRR